MSKERWYYVYMMQSSSRRALYIGVTSDLDKRVWEHKMGMIEGFTARYSRPIASSILSASPPCNSRLLAKNS